MVFWSGWEIKMPRNSKTVQENRKDNWYKLVKKE